MNLHCVNGEVLVFIVEPEEKGLICLLGTCALSPNRLEFAWDSLTIIIHEASGLISDRNFKPTLAQAERLPFKLGHVNSHQFPSIARYDLQVN